MRYALYYPFTLHKPTITTSNIYRRVATELDEQKFGQEIQ